MILAGLLLGLLLLGSACSSDKTEGSFSFPFVAADGTVLRGRIYGNGAIAVVIVHDFDSSQDHLADFAKTLVSRGYMVMTYDMRGSGASPGARDASMASSDTVAAMRYLRTNAERTQVMLVGEGVGGAAVLKAATQERVLAVASVSAPSNFRGLAVLNDIPRIADPKLFVAAEQDADAADAARAFKQRSPDTGQLLLVPGSKHGEGILQGADGQKVRGQIIDFLDAHRPK